MIFRRLIAWANDLWASRRPDPSFDLRAQALRQLAMSLEDLSPPDSSVTTTEQAAYVNLMQTAREAPQRAIVQGWGDVAALLERLASRHALPAGQRSLQRLDALERLKLLSFAEYALLRDLQSLMSEAIATLATEITAEAALDYLAAVRRGQRVLSRLNAGIAVPHASRLPGGPGTRLR